MKQFFLTLIIMIICFNRAVSQLSPTNTLQVSKLLPDYSNVPARELNTFRSFNETFDGNNKMNAYLLSYINYLIYPERLAREVGTTISNTDDVTFEREFRKKFEPMFWTGMLASLRPNIRFVRLPSTSPARSIGLDPEAAIISTSTFIIVAFRGTDRVLSQNELNRKYGEWVGTDFRAPMVSEIGNIPGKVHAGFWKSVGLIRSDLDSYINQFDPNKSKQIWITGHSLGAAQAQLYAAYLLETGKVPAARLHCYMYDGPSFVGDQDFANKVNAYTNKFQRFEYQSDMVTMVAPGLATAVGPVIAAIIGEGCIISCVYRKSGQRNWFENSTSTGYRYDFRERDFALGDVFTLNSGCDHNPNWLVRSLYNQLNASEKSTVPDQAPCSELGAGCNSSNSCQPITPGSIANDVGLAIADFAWTQLANLGAALDNLGTNLLGGRDGNYRIACYNFKNWTKRYLHWDGTISSQLTISTTPTIFTFTKKLTGGYRISKGEGNMSADVEFNVAGFPTGQERTNNIIMRRHDNIIGDEETWYMLKVPNSSNLYVLYNYNTKKVLDAPNNCTAGADCKVNEFEQKSNESTQVWILEKIN